MVLVQLSLHAVKLKNVAGALKGTSDPFAVVTKIATSPGQKAEVLGKTEVVKNSLNPDWHKVFVFDYELGTPTKVAVSLFDEVAKGSNKPMGAAVFEIGELLGARGGTKAKKLKGKGTLYAQVRKSTGSGVFRLQMKGEKLKNTEGLGLGLRKSDPFYELYRKVNAAGGQVWQKVFRSETVRNNLSPQWKQISVEVSILCGGDLDLPILVKVFDYEGKGDHVPMGQFETSANALISLAGSNSDVTLKKKGKDTGVIYVTSATVDGVETPLETKVEAMSIAPAPTSTPVTTYKQKPNFVDYVSGGTELSVTVAIDFTGSNGDPRKPGTLHHIRQDGGLNDYEKAIKSIVGVLQKFDHDQHFPVLGFGAKYDGVVRHAFQCGSREEVDGIDGVLQAYRGVFKSGLIMSKPTVFNEVIEYAAARAESSLEAALARGGQTYSILLIITDGAVSDVAATAACLKRVSDTPLSVVIVGVGNADFSAMHFLDDMHESGKRDIAQFVPFNQHSHCPTDLSSATLHEIPNQLVGYFQEHGLEPGAEIKVDEDEIVVEEEEEEIDLTLDMDDEDEIVVSAGGNAYRSW